VEEAGPHPRVLIWRHPLAEKVATPEQKLRPRVPLPPAAPRPAASARGAARYGGPASGRRGAARASPWT